MPEFTLTAASTHNRWNRDLSPQLTVGSDSVIHIECLDSSGGQVGPDSTLAVPEPFFFRWKLDQSVTRSLIPAIVPLRPFCGVVGVAPGQEGEFRTRPPGVFGGNIDVRDLTAGSTLYLPVQTPGALLSLGDAHAAQGDGEVCINGIECPVDVTVRLKLLKNKKLSAPFVESASLRRETAGEWIMVESDPEPLAAARRATLRMVEFLMEEWDFSREHAYLLCSVAMDLRLAQVVNVPMVTVCAGLAKSIFGVQ